MKGQNWYLQYAYCKKALLASDCNITGSDIQARTFGNGVDGTVLGILEMEDEAAVLVAVVNSGATDESIAIDAEHNENDGS